MEFWASRVHSAKSFSAVHSAHLNNSDDMGDDDMRAWFPCPFCYVDIEVQAICVHLQEEHCFDLRNAVCPICAANLGKDATAHFTTQHAHLVERRRKSQKSGSWSNNSMGPSKNMREMNSYYSQQQMNGRGHMHESVPDPLLSPFLCTIPLPDQETKVEVDADISRTSELTTSEATSTKSAVLDEAQEQDYRERTQRAAFTQQLILSTIF
ncbi:hypothetical protein DCAR_0730049 [Daucus carota subsp. sativus]|uniref:Drought induced 19 protein type zinc-binding domain-containing protein n=1 Tax=Daucus carota subsp. sativus TaxID=79200 RepID=A0A161ZRD8_DAUCS|nr:PREDICTED: protein DEHYDRATION-INDUCED 19 homolog 5-like [Daucus carota subsp. sativus]WOH10580.1 hypothetical protein DCAR_0730049 [Daucus carota subsp. sativus]